MAALFEPITRRTLAEEVRDALLESIRTGELPAGSQFPSERSLCEQFGVARTSVREAIQGLVSLGVIERRANRTYVTEAPPSSPLSDARKRSVTEIFEVRRIVEGPIAGLAACRADDAQRAEIAAIAGTFTVTMALNDFRAADHRFHAAVAAACGNQSLAELHGIVLDTLFRSTDFDSLLSASENDPVVRSIIIHADQAHRDISANIIAGDASGARATTEDHLRQVEALMVGRMK